MTLPVNEAAPPFRLRAASGARQLATEAKSDDGVRYLYSAEVKSLDDHPGDDPVAFRLVEVSPGIKVTEDQWPPFRPGTTRT